ARRGRARRRRRPARRRPLSDSRGPGLRDDPGPPVPAAPSLHEIYYPISSDLTGVPPPWPLTWLLCETSSSLPSAGTIVQADQSCVATRPPAAGHAKAWFEDARGHG